MAAAQRRRRTLSPPTIAAAAPTPDSSKAQPPAPAPPHLRRVVNCAAIGPHSPHFSCTSSSWPLSAPTIRTCSRESNSPPRCVCLHQSISRYQCAACSYSGFDFLFLPTNNKRAFCCSRVFRSNCPRYACKCGSKIDARNSGEL